MDNETVPLEKFTPEQRESWRMTGQEPEAKETAPVKAAEPVKEIEKKPEPEVVEKVAASEAEETESGTVTKTEEQKVGQVKKPGQMGYKELRTKIAELESQIASGKTKPAAADNEAKAKDEQKERPRPRATDHKEDGSPKYDTYEAYEDALLDWRAEKDRATFKQDSVKERQDTQKQELERELDKVVRQRADDARKKYADFDEKALAKDLPISKESVLYSWIMDSEIGMDIAYHYGSHREDLDKFNKLTPFQQARELTRLEDKLSTTSSTTTTEDKKSDVEVVEQKSAPTKVTKAPPPARGVGDVVLLRPMTNHGGDQP